MKKICIIGCYAEEYVAGYYNTGDRMMYWGRLRTPLTESVDRGNRV
jgi:hypothetical protein